MSKKAAKKKVAKKKVAKGSPYKRKPTTKKTTKPSTFSDETADEILRRLIDGESLRSICKTKGMPHESTVRWWVATDEHGDFTQRFLRARDLGLDAMAEETLEISDDGQNDWMERHGEDGENLGWKLNGEHVNRSRLRVDTRKWYLSKLASKRYGEKVEVTNKQELSEASDEELRAAIRQRLANMRDQGIDVSSLIAEGEDGGDS